MGWESVIAITADFSTADKLFPTKWNSRRNENDEELKVGSIWIYPSSLFWVCSKFKVESSNSTHKQTVPLSTLCTQTLCSLSSTFPLSSHIYRGRKRACESSSSHFILISISFHLNLRLWRNGERVHGCGSEGGSILRWEIRPVQRAR